MAEAIYERCHIILAEVKAANALVSRPDTALSGRLRISAPVGAHVLVSLMTHYLAECPQVVIDLVLTDRYVDLVEERFEAVFRGGELADSALVQRSLSRYSLVLSDPPLRTEVGFTRGGECYDAVIDYRLVANDGVALTAVRRRIRYRVGQSTRKALP